MLRHENLVLTGFQNDRIVISSVKVDCPETFQIDRFQSFQVQLVKGLLKVDQN